MLTAELTDNDGWELLIELADNLGHRDTAREFEGALKNEREHLESVRGWLSGRVLEQARV
jgi:hypothetical protein